MSFRQLTLLLLTLALLLWGCADIGALNDMGPLSCDADNDCPVAGQTCQGQRCVDPASNTLPIAIQATFSDYSQRQYTGLTLIPGDSLPDLPPPEMTEAQVTLTRRLNPENAALVFRAERSIPGTKLEVWGEVGAEGGRFSLLPGEYQVTAFPSESSGLPKRTFHQIQIEASTGSVQNITLQLVDTTQGEHLFILPGQIRLAYSTGLEEPARHVKVWARTLDGDYESQESVTCEGMEIGEDESCDATFELLLPAQTNEESRTYELVIEPTSKSVEIPRMVVSQFDVSAALAESELDADTLKLASHTFVATDIPEFKTYYGTVESIANHAPIEGAFVRAEGRFGEEVSFRTSATQPYSEIAGLPTGTDGRFELRIPDMDLTTGDLKLAVTLDFSAAYSSTTFDTLPLSGEELLLSLKEKPTVYGRVLDRNLNPVEQVIVSATPASETESSESTATRSDSEGNYFLSLDQGTYTLRFEPPSTAGLPARSFLQEVTTAPEQLIPDVSLGRSSVVFGRVLDKDLFSDALLPAEGVEIEVFHYLPGDEDALLLGRGTTDDQGTYRVIVPNPDDL